MSRVAIIAVHGVGSPPQFETARSVAELLLQHGSDPSGLKPVSYTEFSERAICIPTTPVVLSEDPGQKPAATATPSLKERAKSFVPGERDRTEFADSDSTAITDLDVAFMRDQLLGYEKASERPPYKTIELIGARVEEPVGVSAAPPIVDDVHVFEMHWADLSRVGKGVLRVLGSLYQLIDRKSTR